MSKSPSPSSSPMTPLPSPLPLLSESAFPSPSSSTQSSPLVVGASSSSLPGTLSSNDRAGLTGSVPGMEGELPVGGALGASPVGGTSATATPYTKPKAAAAARQSSTTISKPKSKLESKTKSKSSGRAKKASGTKVRVGPQTVVIRGLDREVARRAAVVKLAKRKYLPISNDRYPFVNIVDRSVVFGIKCYRVMWDLGVDPATKTQRVSYSYEPAVELRKDGCAPLLGIVDEWVDRVKRRMPFEQFLKSSALAQHVLGASELNDCVFTAVRTCFDLLDRFEVVTPERVSSFLSTLDVDTSDGLAWKKTATFLRMIGMTVPGCALDWGQIGNRYDGSGVGVDAIFRLGLEDGVYLLGSSNSRRVGHCVALRVQWGTYWVFEQEWRPICDVDFIRAVHFVRRLVLLED